MVIKINALDTLFFRDGKPFARGAETWADAVFPPYPSVIYGALRSAYFAEHHKELSKANTPDDPTRSLQITNLYLAVDDQAFYSLPLDQVIKKGSKLESLTIPLSSNKYSEVISSCPTIELLCTKTVEIVETVKGGILNSYDMEDYLNGKTTYISFDQISNYLTSEAKVGIGRDHSTHTSDESFLYRVGMNRLSSRKEFNKETQQLSLVVAFNGLDLKQKGFIRLGGEGKGAVYDQTDEVSLSTNNFDIKENRFKLIFTTPAIFDKGWLPSWLDENTLTGEFNDISLKLITAAIGKSCSIGGFDLKKGFHKPMYQAVPAGSVYYFEVENLSNIQDDFTSKLIDVFHGKALSDKNEHKKQGFGIALIGRVT